jgi:hypothetical protein
MMQSFYHLVAFFREAFLLWHGDALSLFKLLKLSHLPKAVEPHFTTLRLQVVLLAHHLSQLSRSRMFHIEKVCALSVAV